MAFKKFFPQSNDPFLVAQEDMSLAKFGHLNSLVNYVNQIGYGVVNTADATVTLLSSQSGNTIYLAKASGAVYTLPATNQITVGTSYKFVVATTVTSNNYTINTGASTDYFEGPLQAITTSGTYAAPNVTTCVGNGTSHVQLTMNGTTKGGIIGTEFTVVCTSVGKWFVTGRLMYSGSLATPFV